MIKTTLFVCSANVGRSQIAEGYYNFLIKEDKAISAGVKGDTYRNKYNNRPLVEIVALMKEDDIDISNQKIDQLTSGLVKNVERVVILCDRKEVPEKLLEGAKEIIYAHITDPYGQSLGKMRDIRDQIKQLVIKLVES